MDYINNVAEIPVILNLGDIKSEKYNSNYGFLPLIAKEVNKQNETIITSFPEEIDSLMPFIIAELNTQFKSNNFGASFTTNSKELKKNILSKNLNFVAVVKFQATYYYDYLSAHTSFKRIPVASKNSNDWPSRLVTKRKLRGSWRVTFYKTQNNELINIASKAQFVNSKPFQIERYIHNPNTLMRIKSPLSLVNYFNIYIPEAIKKLVEKSEKKHAKALKKRK